MTAKKVITIVLIIFVTFSVGFLVFKEFRKNNQGVSPANSNRSGETKHVRKIRPDRLAVYYFHGKKRCITCKKIESLSEETVRERFAEELKSGEIEWKVIDFSKSGNERYKKEYELTSQTLVLVEFKEGKRINWKPLPGVWEYVSSEDDFKKYVTDELRAFPGEDR